jgi:hypothetical protein
LQLDRGLRNHQRCAQLRQQLHFTGIAHDVSIIRRVTNYANHFRMIRITGDYDIASLSCGSFRQVLNSRHKRARGIDNFRGAFFKFALDLRRNSVGTNYGDCVGVGFAG